MRSAIMLIALSTAVLAAPTYSPVHTRAVPDVRIELKDDFVRPVVNRAAPDIHKIIEDTTEVIKRLAKSSMGAIVPVSDSKL
jgi:hypothetical protein